MTTISAWTEIPEFESDEDESAFWAKHSLDPRLINASIHSPDSRESTTITLRFDPRMLSRIKRIARSRFLNYQSMMKQWLAERMEEEMRRSGDAEEEK
ncbi:BrnA antitoxin family protein [Akkermansiaceae bacterium]|nr:BrnA antitoxin family protein [Akkermansiaceae bacterium]MDB4276699.1 BrnA antitoxin family protein [bacterium]MDA7877207.1 BrnA antitoxin family protein [Akkermansiaceae bacterium]MDB0056189.1 BrnA antitoxin family protein [Akkermansiaceae bacterium]MDB0067877.1 BrnA antitoxin family protein [Akkermansiaceae bacterium]